MLELSRFEMLVGKQNIEKLKNSSVIIFGVGGVGSYAAEAIARAGIGRITLVDYDEVCITNINRQIHANRKTVGLDKVEAMKNRIDDMGIGTIVTAHKGLYNEETHNAIFSEKYDFVVDAIDMVTSKLKLAEYCYNNKINIIASMGTGNKFHPELLEITGGIIQGMSGAPILQNGKIAGAVTNVFVNDPARGYGIFIENMLKYVE